MSEADIQRAQNRTLNLFSKVVIPKGADELALRRVIKQMHRTLHSARPYRGVVFDAERTLVHRPGGDAVGELQYLLDLLGDRASHVSVRDWAKLQHEPLSNFFPDHKLSSYKILSAYQRGLSPYKWLQCAEMKFGFSLTRVEREDIIEKVTLFFAEHVDWVPGAKELLRELRRAGLKVAVTTDVDYIANFAVRRLLADEVDTFVSSWETGMKKPEPAIFRYALEQLGSTPVTTLYVGDGGSTEMEGAGYGHPESPWKDVRVGVGMDTSLILHPDGYASTHPADRHCREAAMTICEDISQIRKVPRLAMALSIGARRITAA